MKEEFCSFDWNQIESDSDKRIRNQIYKNKKRDDKIIFYIGYGFAAFVVFLLLISIIFY